MSEQADERRKWADTKNEREERQKDRNDDRIEKGTARLKISARRRKLWSLTVVVCLQIINS